jgi:hypothetical protein
MGKIPRKNPNGQYSEAYLRHIQYTDWQGRLTPDEVEIARDNGFLKWDLWKKTKRLFILTQEQRKKMHTAPVFGPDGKPDKDRYPEGAKFFIQDYNDLKRLQKAKNAK